MGLLCLLNIHRQSLTAWFLPPATRVPSLRAEAPTALSCRAELLCVPVAAGRCGRVHGRPQVVLQEVEKGSHRHLKTFPVARRQHEAPAVTRHGERRLVLPLQTSQAESDRTEAEVSHAEGQRQAGRREWHCCEFEGSLHTNTLNI